MSTLSPLTRGLALVNSSDMDTKTLSPISALLRSPTPPIIPSKNLGEKSQTATSSSTPRNGHSRSQSKNDLFKLDWKWQGGANIESPDKTRSACQTPGSSIQDNHRNQSIPNPTKVTIPINTSLAQSKPSNSIFDTVHSVSIPTIPTTPPPSSRAPQDYSSFDRHAGLVPLTPPLSGSSFVYSPAQTTTRSKVKLTQQDLNRIVQTSTPDGFSLQLDLDNKHHRIGNGRYSRVMAARYTSTSMGETGDKTEAPSVAATLCAVKVYAADEEGWDMAANENNILQRLSQNQTSTHTGSKAIVQVLGLEAESILDLDQALTVPRPLLALAYYANGSVDSYLKRSIASNITGMDDELWKKWLRQILTGLDWMQQQRIVHCDIKPSNLLLDEVLNLVICDFSSSIVIDDSSESTSGDETSKLPTDGIGRGTPPYSSPEIVDPSSTRPFSFPTDIFSLGATFYSLITGTEPFRGTRSIELMWHVRKGRFWEWEERARVDRIGFRAQSSLGSPVNHSTHSPLTPTTPTSAKSVNPNWYPGHHHARSLQIQGSVKRTESLRERHLGGIEEDGKTKSSSSSRRPISRKRSQTGVEATSLLTSLANASAPLSQDRPHETAAIISTVQSSLAAYSDGTPAMIYSQSNERVDEAIWKMLKSMVDPDQYKRLTAAEYLSMMPES